MKADTKSLSTSPETVTVACVLKTGGIYTVEWVYALARHLSRHLTDYRFVCLTDDPAVPWYWRRPLTEGWPGWWAKMETFNPARLSGRVLYMDLDTLPVGDLSDIAGYRGQLAMLSDFYQPRVAQSGVMAFEAGPGSYAAALYDAFRERSADWIRGYRGDGEWLHAHTDRPDRLQDRYPGQIASLKVHAKKAPPLGARLVCAHGNPKFSDPAAGWAHERWRS